MIEDIIKYIDGELEGESLKDFESRLSTDDNLKAETEAARVAKKIAEGFIESEIFGYLRNSKENIKPITEPASRPKSVSRKLFLMGIVASAACLLFFFYVKFNPTITETTSSDQIYAMHYHEPIWEGERGDADQPLNLLIAKYLNGDTEVINNLLSSDLLDKDYHKKRYWAAEILLREKRCTEASGIADELLKVKLNTSRCHYIKALCLLLSNKKTEAIAYINEVPKSELDRDELAVFEKIKE